MNREQVTLPEAMRRIEQFRGLEKEYKKLQEVIQKSCRHEAYLMKKIKDLELMLKSREEQVADIFEKMKNLAKQKEFFRSACVKLLSKRKNNLFNEKRKNMKDRYNNVRPTHIQQYGRFPRINSDYYDCRRCIIIPLVEKTTAKECTLENLTPKSGKQTECVK